MIDDPYKNLANAIIVQAAKDYQKALRQLQRNPKYPEAAYRCEAPVLSFFHILCYHEISRKAIS